MHHCRPTKNALSTLGSAVVALWAMLALTRVAHAREPVTVVVVLDSSGSMRENGHDPKGISKFAVEVLGRFLDDDDRLGVVPLGRSEATIPPTRLAELRDRLPSALDAIPYDGGTPCAARLADARKMLDAAGGAGPRSVVLLTDGVCHQGDDDKESKDNEARDLARDLRANGVPIFGIPLGAAADVDFVRELSAGAELEWQVERVEEARQLPVLFAALSGALQNTEARSVSAPRGDQTLAVDPYLRSITLLATVDGGPVHLRRITDPLGERKELAPTEGQFPRRERSKRHLSGYSLVKLLSPEPGDWTLQVDAAADPSAVIVYDYDLRAALELADPEPPRPGATVELRATLRTPDGDPVEASFLSEATATLQVRGPAAASWSDAQAMTWDGVAWFTAKVPLAEMGRYRVRARIARGRSLDLRTYADIATVPGLTLTVPASPCLPDGSPAVVSVSLVAAGAPDALANRAASLDVRLWAQGPGQSQPEPVLSLTWDDTRRAFEGTFGPTEPGAYTLEARLRAGPGMTARSNVVSAHLVHARVAVSEAPLDLGAIKAGDTATANVDWRGTTSVPLELTMKTAGVTAPDDVRVEASGTTIRPGDAPAPLSVRLITDEGSAGGSVSGAIAVSITGHCVASDALSFSVPISAKIVPLTFWERLERLWRDQPWVVIGLGVLLLLLIYGALVLLCMRRTHAFGPTLSVAIADKPGSGFTQFKLVTDYPGTRRRFLVPLLRCRHARLYWNVNNDDFGDTRSPTWFLEATRDGGARLVLPDGATAEAASANTPSKIATLDTPCDLVSDTIYKVGSVYFRVM